MGGVQYGGTVSTLQTLGTFVGIPAAAFAIIALLCVVPSWARDPRYRPGLTWKADPTWIGGPEDPDRPAAPTGADRPAIGGEEPGDAADDPADRDEAASRTGGASASW